MGFKVLVIAALLALLLLLVYTKLHPYLQVLKKIMGVAKAIVEPQPGVRGTARSVSANNQSKLVRCEGCGTWVPAGRAIASSAGTATYCCRECLEKPAAAETREAAR